MSLDAYWLIVSKNTLILAPDASVMSVPDASCAYVLLLKKIESEPDISEFEKRNLPLGGVSEPDGVINLNRNTFIAVDELPIAPVGPVGPVQPVGPVRPCGPVSPLSPLYVARPSRPVIP